MAFRTSDKNRPNLTMVPTQASSRTSFHSFSPSSRENINPHSRTFSIARVRRKRQRLPSSLVIESAVKISVQLHLAAPALPMNASDLSVLIVDFKVRRSRQQPEEVDSVPYAGSKTRKP